MNWLQLGIIYTTVYFDVTKAIENNVCRTLEDYQDIVVNQNCWYNPDLDSSTESISLRYGYKTEKYTVMTEDGYMLILYRLSKNNSKPNETKQPVILQYGIAGATEFWVLRGRNSIAFYLCDNGYDIWLTTIRGSIPGVTNERLLRKNPKYWDFSFHENGMYDLPATIDYISKITNRKKKLIYIGHSMGTTMSYTYAIEKSKHAQDNLKGIISLAPVMYLRSLNYLFQELVNFVPLILEVTKALNIHVVAEHAWFRDLIFITCSTYPGILICDYLATQANGKSLREFTPDLFPVFMKYYPTPTSFKTINHYGQILKSKRFQKFDYGASNQNKYRSMIPPEYDVNKISLPIHFFIGTNDALAILPDVNILYNKLKENGVNTTKYVFDFAHNDYFTARYYKEFYMNLLNVLDDLSKIKV